MSSHKATIQLCGNSLFILAAVSSLLRVFVALFLVYSYLLGFTGPVEWIQRYIPKMYRYSLDLVAVLKSRE